ncbi:hypothetical protein KC361_g132 [Hortaea werneckii]|nr:hypothetical protein KC361_g132 [Hortaea werneckii]
MLRLEPRLHPDPDSRVLPSFLRIPSNLRQRRRIRIFLPSLPKGNIRAPTRLHLKQPIPSPISSLDRPQTEPLLRPHRLPRRRHQPKPITRQEPSMVSLEREVPLAAYDARRDPDLADIVRLGRVREPFDEVLDLLREDLAELVDGEGSGRVR